MRASIEISLYPLRGDFIPPIQDFIDRLNADARLTVETNTMSTQIFGEYAHLMEVLTREMATTFARAGTAIFVLKVLGPRAG
jgi:uncharacterized protein YqgV (UPF0045/DUF77 family)